MNEDVFVIRLSSFVRPPASWVSCWWMRSRNGIARVCDTDDEGPRDG